MLCMKPSRPLIGGKGSIYQLALYNYSEVPLYILIFLRTDITAKECAGIDFEKSAITAYAMYKLRRRKAEAQQTNQLHPGELFSV